MFFLNPETEAVKTYSLYLISNENVVPSQQKYSNTSDNREILFLHHLSEFWNNLSYLYTTAMLLYFLIKVRQPKNTIVINVFVYIILICIIINNNILLLLLLNASWFFFLFLPVYQRCYWADGVSCISWVNAERQSIKQTNAKD